jgi:hypothetical protein
MDETDKELIEALVNELTAATVPKGCHKGLPGEE